MKTALTSCPAEAPRAPVLSSRAIRRVRTRRILLEASIREQDAAAKLGGGADANLQQDRETAAALRIRFKDMVQERRRRKRGNLRRTIKINTKQF